MITMPGDEEKRREEKLEIILKPRENWPSKFDTRNKKIIYHQELIVKESFPLDIMISNKSDFEVNSLKLILNYDPAMLKFLAAPQFSIKGIALENNRIIIYQFNPPLVKGSFFMDSIPFQAVRKGECSITAYATVKVNVGSSSKDLTFPLPVEITLKIKEQEDYYKFYAAFLPQVAYVNKQIIYHFSITNFSEKKSMRNIKILNIINEYYLNNNFLKLSDISSNCQLSGISNIKVDDISPHDSKIIILTFKPKRSALINTEPTLSAELNGININKKHDIITLLIQEEKALDENTLMRNLDFSLQANTIRLRDSSSNEAKMILSHAEIDDSILFPQKQIFFEYSLSHKNDKITLNFIIINNSPFQTKIHKIILPTPQNPQNSIEIEKTLTPQEKTELQTQIPPPENDFVLTPALIFSLKNSKKFTTHAHPQTIIRGG